jgi:hypothetical protein
MVTLKQDKIIHIDIISFLTRPGQACMLPYRTPCNSLILIEMNSEKLTFVVGTPRSGTTWLAKILDSHPQVLYRHEPDISHRADDIPLICGPDDTDYYLRTMERYVQELLATRTVKSAGKPPVFRKSFDGPLTFALRVGSVYALRILQEVLPRSLSHRLTVPDFGSPFNCRTIHPVIKSVSALGRIGLMLKAVPSARVIMIVRDPLGQVASRLDGLARGKFERNVGFDCRLLVAKPAKEFGLNEALLSRMPLAAQLAWEWAVLNAVALNTLRGLPQTRVVRYADLLAAPLRHAQELIAFAGLSWHPATERFIDRSTRYKGADHYYNVFRDSETQRNKWRRRLDLTAERQILAVIRAAEIGQICPELLA